MNKLSWKTKNVWEKGDEYNKKPFPWQKNIRNLWTVVKQKGKP